jgi:hypothetical protein
MSFVFAGRARGREGGGLKRGEGVAVHAAISLCPALSTFTLGAWTHSDSE